MERKMGPHAKKLWIKALHLHKQGNGRLRDGDKFCCLGVLCNVYAHENPELVEDETDPDSLFGERYVLPHAVQSWAGLQSINPTIGKYNAIILNDSRGKSFAEIADLIEKHL